MKTTALAPWFGSNRMLAHHVGEALAGLKWVGVPFAGGMTELLHITAPTLVVSDRHRHVINLARVVQRDDLRAELIRVLDCTLYHPDALATAQTTCRDNEPDDAPDLELAAAYFICAWMGRSGKSGTRGEFTGNLPIRNNGNGGDSCVRFRSAIRSLVGWFGVMRRANFHVRDALEFIASANDDPTCGLYCDPPFVGAGEEYQHNCGRTEAEQVAWHTTLAQHVSRFARTRVVMRFYDHPLVRELYPDDRWHWEPLAGRKQTNESAPEVLLVNGGA